MSKGSRKGNAPDDGSLLELFDVLGQRWALRIIWQLRAAPMTYRALAAAVPGLSTSVLAQRLRDLRAADLIRHEEGAGYQLTDNGTDLLSHLQSLRQWADEIDFKSGQ